MESFPRVRWSYSLSRSKHTSACRPSWLIGEELDSTNNALDFTAAYTYDLTGNRLERTIDWGSDTNIDEVTSYTYDANDRLTTEELDTDGMAGAEQTTDYDYSHTQQTDKTVTQADGSAVATSYAYDLQGRLQVITVEPLYTSSVVTRRERLTYGYDASGIRTSTLQEIDADADNTYETRTRTEFLVDSRNHTGYQQVLRETHYDADTDLITKTVDYTFGHDEIAQTTQAYDGSGQPDGDPVTLVFGHDGHGSVRVLTDLAAAALQFFVYDAYGQLVAIMNGAAALTSGGSGTLADASAALTTILYSGEQFDAASGLQYLRARYYDPATGRFNRLDPFFGNLSDPQSFHKYLFGHADPVTNIDPTGLMTLAAKIAVAGISGALIAVGVNAYINHFILNRDPLEGAVTAALVGGTIGIGALFSPWVLYAAGIYSVALSSAIFIDVVRDPNATRSQKYAAGLLVVVSILGTVRARGYAGRWSEVRANAGQNRWVKWNLQEPVAPVPAEPTMGEMFPKVPDDAMIHLSPQTPETLAPGVTQGYWVRFGDVKHLTLPQYRNSVVGPGAPGSSPNANTLAIRLDATGETPGGTPLFQPRGAPNFAGITEYQQVGTIEPNIILEANAPQ